jgi:hypothetical protein
MTTGLAKLMAAAAAAAAADAASRPGKAEGIATNQFVLRVTGHKDPVMLSLIKSGQAKQLKEALLGIC